MNNKVDYSEAALKLIGDRIFYSNKTCLIYESGKARDLYNSRIYTANQLSLAKWFIGSTDDKLPKYKLEYDCGKCFESEDLYGKDQRCGKCELYKCFPDVGLDGSCADTRNPKKTYLVLKKLLTK